jgi:GT2 family glycosyltransferase
MGIPGKSNDSEVFLGFNHKESYFKLTKFTQIKKTYLNFLLTRNVNYFPCDFPSGLMILFSKSFFQKLGYFDEELFFSGDETDFAVRVSKNKNIKSFVSLKSYDLVDHVSFGTSGNSLIKNKNYVRGYVYILLKHTDKVFSLRYWARLFYFVATIVYERPAYAPFLMYHAILSTFEFRKIYKYK